MKNPNSVTSRTLLFLNGIALFIALIALVSITFSCNDESCAYDPRPYPAGCTPSNSLNLSTGIDPDGNVLAPGQGVVDPFWKLINIPPLAACTSSLASTINGSAYVVNPLNTTTSGWVNQVGSSTLAPVDLGLGNTGIFGCDNAKNKDSIPVPYVFQRCFCVIKDTEVDFNFTFEGDDTIHFELKNSFTGAVLSTSPGYRWDTSPPSSPVSWSAASLPLSSGSYCLRGYLINTNNIVLGFSLVGDLTTTNGDLAISDNAKGCCENNTISILNILEETCDGIFNGDQVGNGWTFNLLDASNNLVATGVSDINGNVFFAGLADGTYTVQIVPQGGWTPSSVSTTVTIANNDVAIIDFFNCK